MLLPPTAMPVDFAIFDTLPLMAPLLSLRHYRCLMLYYDISPRLYAIRD